MLVSGRGGGSQAVLLKIGGGNITLSVSQSHQCPFLSLSLSYADGAWERSWASMAAS